MTIAVFLKVLIKTISVLKASIFVMFFVKGRLLQNNLNVNVKSKELIISLKNDKAIYAINFFLNKLLNNRMFNQINID